MVHSLRCTLKICAAVKDTNIALENVCIRAFRSPPADIDLCFLSTSFLRCRHKVHASGADIPLHNFEVVRTLWIHGGRLRCLTHVLGSFDEASQSYVVEYTTRSPTNKSLFAPHHRAFHAFQHQSLQVIFYGSKKRIHNLIFFDFLLLFHL